MFIVSVHSPVLHQVFLEFLWNFYITLFRSCIIMAYCDNMFYSSFFNLSIVVEILYSIKTWKVF